MDIILNPQGQPYLPQPVPNGEAWAVPSHGDEMHFAFTLRDARHRSASGLFQTPQ